MCFYGTVLATTAGAAPGATTATIAAEIKKNQQSHASLVPNDAFFGNLTDCFSSIVESVKNQAASLLGGSVAGGAVGQ